MGDNTCLYGAEKHVFPAVYFGNVESTIGGPAEV